MTLPMSICSTNNEHLDVNSDIVVQWWGGGGRWAVRGGGGDGDGTPLSFSCNYTA